MGPRGGTMGPRGASFLLGRTGVAADAVAYLAEGLAEVVVGSLALLINDGYFLVGHRGGDSLHALDEAVFFVRFVQFVVLLSSSRN